MRGGASLCKSLETPRKVLDSASCRCLRNGHNRSDVGGITEIPRVLGGIRTGDLALSIVIANRQARPDALITTRVATRSLGPWGVHVGRLAASTTGATQPPCNQSAAQLQDVGIACSASRPKHTRAWMNQCPHTNDTHPPVPQRRTTHDASTCTLVLCASSNLLEPKHRSTIRIYYSLQCSRRIMYNVYTACL
jgi:hypothetical protein